MAKQLRRRKKNGKHIGSWLYGGVNLDTQDARLARSRAKLVDAGKWPPEDAAAAEMAESLRLDGASVDPIPADPAPSPPPSEPSVPFVENLADGVAAAAAEAAGAAPADGAAPIDPEVVASAIDPDKLAAPVVDVMFRIQAAVIKFAHRRATKDRDPPTRLEIPPVPPDNFGHQIMCSAMAAQLKIWFADMNPTPAQVICAGMAIGAVFQMQNATEVIEVKAPATSAS
ncbi:MAG: hypothetical protein PHR30_18470 [Gallionellaceae bacterium]|nr:hypothetical protein [Gallionellaceae bacterium]